MEFTELDSPPTRRQLPFHLVTNDHLAALGPAIHACFRNREVHRRGRYGGHDITLERAWELRGALHAYLGSQPARIRRPAEAVLLNISDDLLEAVRQSLFFTPLPPDAQRKPNGKWYYTDKHGHETTVYRN